MSLKSYELNRAKRGWVKFLKSSLRKEKTRQKKAGRQRHIHNVVKRAKFENREYTINKIPIYSVRLNLPPKPNLPYNIDYLVSIPELFSKSNFSDINDSHLEIPSCFSLLENYEESFEFLKRLFTVLHFNKTDKLILDYGKCERIDVDASICMDIMLAEFISYFKHCRRLGHKAFNGGIHPTNIISDDVKKVLFSIGAFRNLKGYRQIYKDVEDLPVIINDNTCEEVWSNSELDLTNIVEYIKRCIGRFNKELSVDSEKEFYKVIGEIMSNSLEHSTRKHSFSIGYFQEFNKQEEHFGIFNFSIFNFGDTIYQTFKSNNCQNPISINQMTNLSADYTKNGWFKKASFEEETLWTLYALQEGVTSKPKKRGNGSIQFIENFFKLKGDSNEDNISRMAIVSGNTRISFDGTYNIVERTKETETGKRNYKMITFNESGEINEVPDKKYVTFAPHFFPGTLISARILIKFDNISNI